DLMEENAAANTHHQVALGQGPESKANARREIEMVRRKHRIGVHSLNYKPLVRNKVGDVLAVAVERPEVLVAQTVVYVQPVRELPTVRSVKIERVHGDQAFRISNCNRRGFDVAREEISQSFGRGKLLVIFQV